MGSNSLIHTVLIYLLPIFSFISSYISRLRNRGGYLKKNDEEIIFLDAEKNATEPGNFGYFNAEEVDKPELLMKFKFPKFEEFNKFQEETGTLFNSKVVSSVSKYEFVSGKDFLRGFIQEPETFPVKEFNGNEHDEVFSDIKFVEIDEETGDFQEFTEMFDNKVNSVEKMEYLQVNQEFLEESHFSSEKNIDDFLSDGDFGIEFEENEKSGSESKLSGLEENQAENEKSELESDISGLEKDQGLETELSGLERDQGLGTELSGLEKDQEFFSEKDFNENLNHKTNPGFVSNNDGSEKSRLQESSLADSGDSNKLESLWEHQELIEQLKMELKKVRATGLPTILEESESPKIMDDHLKPWKIDENSQHEDCIGELHKFYKSYTEIMRKFDILNYQKMYAMGFLQLKDPFQPTPQQKPPTPTLKSLVSQNVWLFKHKSRGRDPIKKFINELQGDLEVVYVGHICLSWEFLHWQYEKALELWHSDPNGIHRYNEVAGEFQQFQVLVQRFIEDGPFQGPRVQSYVKSRCVLRNLLQIPLIREDNLKDKKKARKKEGDEQYVITSEMLVEIVEESIRIFWLFVRSDKDCNIVAVNGHKKMKLPELHNNEDVKLLIEVRKTLQKKERKLKDILRSESCILRKFRQSKEVESDQALYFFSQLDMKLVSRVLNMSKITRDQLSWCQNKLSRISFANRKIYVEPAFLLFPY